MDPARPVRVRFGRRELDGRPGERWLAMLGRRGWPSLARSVRYHRPRGPFCGVGDCTGCLFRLNGVPNARACVRPVRDGDRASTENAWPSPRNDLLGLLDGLFPHGLDTVHGLRRPAFLRPVFQSVVRRLAGYGAPPDSAAPALPPRSWTAEVAVVGAGRSGRSVADALARKGRRPLLLERRSGPGAGDGPAGETVAGVTVSVLSAAEDGAGFTLLGFADDGAGVRVRTPTVIVATGSYDAGLVFEGSDRPGVVTADLALSELELPLGPSVVVGTGPRALQVVERHADRVEAVVAFGDVGPELTRTAAEAGISLYPRSRLVRAIGRGHVRAVELARRDGGGRFRLPCSSVVLAHRRLPNAQLLYQAGATRRWSETPGAYFPEIDPAGRTAVPGLYAVGSAAAPPGSPPVDPGAVAAAVTSARPPEPPAAFTPSAAERPGELVGYYRELLREARHGKWIVCPCEDVLLEEVEAASRRGFRGLEVVKRYTGAGTGLCQGRYCLPDLIVLLSLLEQRSAAEVGFITQRPPLVPTPLGALATLDADAGGGSGS